MGTSYNPSITTSGLVFYFDAANPRTYPPSGSYVYDLSGNNFVGALCGATTAYSNSMMFNGTDGCIKFDVLAGSVSGSSMTICSFFYWDGTLMTRDICGKRHGTGNYEQYNIGIRTAPNDTTPGDNFVIFANSDFGNSSYYLQLQTKLPRAGWHYGCISIGTLSQTMYMNTSACAFSNVNYTGQKFTISGNSFYVGAINANGTDDPYMFWNNKIGVVQVYNRALTSFEIQQNYNAIKSRYGL